MGILRSGNGRAVLKTGDTGLQYLVDKLELTQVEKQQLNINLTDPTINEGIQRNIGEENSLGFHSTPVFLSITFI